MKDCKQCGGSGVVEVPTGFDELAPKLCPCVTEKLARYKRALEDIVSEEALHSNDPKLLVASLRSIAMEALEGA